jgi:Gpi18-like mannosyltransferase
MGMILSKFKISEQRELLLLLLFGTVLSLVLRYTLFPFESDDLRSYIIWVQYIHDNGGFKALGDPFYNYNPPYLYLLALASYLPKWIPDGYIVKIVSLPFEIITALFAAKILIKSGASNKVALLGYCILLVLPTVLLNGSFWGQCDSIFTCFIVISIYYLITNRPTASIMAFAISVALKLQAMVFGPALLCYFIAHRIRIRDVIWAPVVFLALLIPAILLGRGFISVLQTYPAQAEYFRNVNLNAPNFYIWISDGDLYKWLPDTLFFIIKPAGYVLSVIYAVLLASLVRYKKNPFSTRIAINIAFVSTLVTPYFLPMMHERYFYAGDILSIIWVFLNPRFFIVPLLVQAASIHTYLNYLYAKGFLNHSQLFDRTETSAIIMTVAVIAAFYVLCISLFKSDGANNEQNISEEKDAPNSLQFLNLSIPKWLGLIASTVLIFVIFIVINNHPSSVASKLKLPITTSAITDSTGLKEIPFIGRISATKYSQSYGIPKYDADLRGYPLMVNNRQYRYGICSHSDSSIEFNLDQKYSKITGKVGFPDYISGRGYGSVVFELVADGQSIWKSSIERPKQSLTNFEVSVQNVKVLELKMNNGGDGMNSDHGCWLDTSLIPN